MRWERLRAEYGAIAVVLALFVLFGLAASVLNPLHEATDELRHYRFVRHIVQRQSLPVQGQVGCSAQGHHPPLFYTLGALTTFWVDTGRDVCYEPEINPFWNYRQWEVSGDNKNLYLHGPDEAFPWAGEALAAHWVRALNVLLGAATVLLTWRIGRVIWPDRPFLALGGAAFIAFNPMFVYMAGAINNDVIAALAGTAVTLACVMLLRDEQGLSPRWGVRLGVLYSVALLSKFNLLAIGGSIAAAATWVAWRKRQWRGWVQVGLIIAGVTLLLTGWWFVRNQLLYGEPTGVRRLTELWGVRDPSESWGLAIYELKPTWTSLWGRFGYGQIPMPEPIYDGLRWVIGVGMAGLLLALPWRRDQRRSWRQEGPALLLLLLNLALFFVVVFNYLLISPAGAMGRFFFPALSSLSILAFYGLSRWGVLLARQLRPERALALLVNGGMAALTAVALWGYLGPAYARPEPFDAETAVPNPTDAQFDVLANLRGYEIHQPTVRAGEPLDIDLYWEVTAQPPGNYLLFVHVIDNETGAMIVQRDTHPGVGNAPTRYWQPGEMFVDSIRVWLPETAYTPASATVSIGLYAPGAYRLGITGADGAGLGDALTLGEVAIAPSQTPGLAQPYPNPLNVNFGDDVRLVGYAYSARQLASGEPLDVTLVWQALRDGLPDYEVQLTVVDTAGNVVQTAVSRPQTAIGATDTWSRDAIIEDTHRLQLDPSLPAGYVDIHVALLDARTKAPQNILAEDGHILDNRLHLSSVQVRP